MRIFNKFAPRITSTASATTFYPYISMCANCDFSENIAWVFWVNRVFWAFFIYPIYPKNPKYYLFVFSSPVKRPIRITDSFSFDYADSPYHMITFFALLPRTFCKHISPLLKSPQKFIPKSYLFENQHPILNYAAWRKWRLWRKLLRHSATSAISATCTFLTQKKVFFCSNTCVYAFFVVPLHPKWWFMYHQTRCFLHINDKKLWQILN